MIKAKRILLNFPLLRWFNKKTKRWILPGFEGVPLYDVMQFFWRQLRMSSLTERASAISYNFIMSIPPTCLFLFTLIPNLPFIPKKTIKSELNSLIVQIVPSKTYNSGLISFVDSFLKGSQIGLISFGFALSLFFASNAMMGVMRSFDKDYIGFEKRKGLHKRWVALKLTSLLFALLLICLLLLLSQAKILTFIGIKSIFMKEIILYGKWIVITLLIFWSFAIIYKYAPATQKRWDFFSPGALMATFLSILATLGFGSFVNNFGRYNILYGSIGTIIVVMTLIFINSLIVLIGFELNVSIKSLRSIAEDRRTAEAKATKLKVSDNAN